MPEPTIDEMLEWYDEAIDTQRSGKSIYQAIRSILEQHRDDATGNIYIKTDRGYELVQFIPAKWPTELQAIRAVMERAEKRAQANWEDAEVSVSREAWRMAFIDAIYAEVAAMEKEAE
jgi:hypothetical protein